MNDPQPTHDRHASSPDPQRLSRSAPGSLAIPGSGSPSDRIAGPDLAALDSEIEIGALRSLADERVVHGLLRTVSNPDRAPMDRRVAGAVEALGDGVDQELGHQVLGHRELGHGELGHGRDPRRRPTEEVGPRGGSRRLVEPGRVRRRITALAARILPVVALIAVAAILLRVSTQSSSAIADPLERVVAEHVKAGDKAGPRRYSILIERDTPQGLVPLRGTVDIAPGGGRRPDGSMLRGGRFLVRLGGGDRGPRVAFGFDGESFWYVPEEGPVRTGPSKAVIEDANQLRGLVGWLVVERALRQLQPEPSEASSPAGGPLFELDVDELDGGMRRHTLRRRDDRGPHNAWPAFRPSEVVFEAGATDRVVSTFDAYWPDDESGRSRHPGRIKHLRFELLRDQVPPPEWDWFSHTRHHDAEREVVSVPERAFDRPGERLMDGFPRRPLMERPGGERGR